MFKLKFIAKTFAKSIFWSEVTFGRRTHFSEIGAKSDSLWVQFEPGSPIWILKSDSSTKSDIQCSQMGPLKGTQVP